MNKVSGWLHSKKRAYEEAKMLRHNRARAWLVVYEKLSNIPPAELSLQMYGAKVWQEIFCVIFRRSPKSDRDFAWDVLFSRTGYRALTAADQWYRQRRRR